MGPLIALPIILILLVVAAGVVFGGGYAVRQMLAAHQARALEAAQPLTLASPPVEPNEGGWLDGDDLLRYPRRLSELETKLGASFQDVRRQTEHLDDRLDSLKDKDGRDEIASRYKSDLTLLNQRGRSMRRVLGLVWRTRAILQLRAHLAISARQRPALGELPGVDVDIRAIDDAVDAYEVAASRVRRFTTVLEDRANGLPLAVPGVPADADTTEALQETVQAELARIEQTYASLRERMDHLADSLVYLSDRCRTRRVVEGSPTSIDAYGGEALIDEVNHALSALNELASVGALHMADSTLDALAEDISQLERAGLEAKAEADAALEIDKLLEHFPAR